MYHRGNAGQQEKFTTRKHIGNADLTEGMLENRDILCTSSAIFLMSASRVYFGSLGTFRAV